MYNIFTSIQEGDYEANQFDTIHLSGGNPDWRPTGLFAG
jgi:hypothetical protein